MAPPTPADPLDGLRERIRATQQAAERLAGDVPPAGWATPADDDTHDELRALAALLQTLRATVPPELQAQVNELVRQVLLLVRAVVDWWVDRLETPPGAGVEVEIEVEDIPIS